MNDKLIKLRDTFAESKGDSIMLRKKYDVKSILVDKESFKQIMNIKYELELSSVNDVIKLLLENYSDKVRTR